jgi:CheY-like chemotaxis protein
MSGVARVLVVDDHALNIELVAYTLEADGFEVLRAGDAAQALACLAREVPDLILMDIQLPGMDGLTLTRQLRRDPSMQQC